MPREYYVYPNGTPIAVAGNNEYATQIPMSAGDPTDVYTAISDKADNVSLPASQGGTDLTLVTTGDKYNWNNNDASNKVSKSGDTMSGQLKFSNNNVANIEVPSRSLTYINKYGNAGVHGLKEYNVAAWYPVVCQDTKGGGHWQIGNYNTENLEFVYGTKTNRDSDTNNTQRFSLVPWNDNNNHDAEIITSKNIGSQSVASATSATSATTATGAGQLNARGTASGTNHATALQAFFNTNKASIPRNVGINIYSSAYSNGSTCFGYFLNGYDTAPYGGFFIAHYNTPKYVGIQGGSYSEQNIITSSTIASQSVSYATSAGTATTYAKLTAPSGNTTTNYTAKSWTIPDAATEIVIACRYTSVSKLFCTSVPKAVLNANNQQLWVSGGRGNTLGSMNGDSARCLCNVKISGTTFTLQGVSCTNEGTPNEPCTWYVYYR